MDTVILYYHFFSFLPLLILPNYQILLQSHRSQNNERLVYSKLTIKTTEKSHQGLKDAESVLQISQERIFDEFLS